VNKDRIIIAFLLGIFLLFGARLKGQDPTARFKSMGGSKSSDSTLKHRDATEDSITINYRYLDSSRLRKLDSTVYDFTKKFPVPWNYIDLGNSGTASKNLIFTPLLKSGWDEGLHSFDIYMLTPENTRFFTTTRPYAELGYLVGSKSEQVVDINFAQNIKPNWNYAFQYRLINSPGTFNSQNTNHNSYRLNSWYQSHNKRYQGFLILIANKLASSENGGLVNFHDLDSNTLRSNIPTVLNNQSIGTNNIFSTTIYTGTEYNTANFWYRQQYDIIGKKDSIVTDSTVIPLFYPQFRAEHTIQYNTYSYRFFDTNLEDTSFYRINYGIIFPSPYIIQPGFASDTFYKQDKWKQLVNDLSLYQFPDSKNPQQFIKVGATLENFSGVFDSTSREIFNLFLHGEYRNRTRNQKWDIEAYGKFYLVGYNAADYNASVSLKRYISKQIGYLQLGFQNADRTPSFVFNRSSSFSFSTPNFNKENITSLFGSLDQPLHQLKFTANYYLISNYAYFEAYSKEEQQSSLFNVLQIGVEKVIRLRKNWIWRIALELQQKAGSSPVNLPLLLTHNQIGYEGSLGFRNLKVSFGLEFRYYTGYKADGYDPIEGQFYTQNDTTIRMRLPDITPYVNLRIRGFTAYVRAENVNTAQIGPNGFGFTNYNFVAPNYPNTGLRIRIGIYWSFVN
jgi:hypothetical protein